MLFAEEKIEGPGERGKTSIFLDDPLPVASFFRDPSV